MKGFGSIHSGNYIWNYNLYYSFAVKYVHLIMDNNVSDTKNVLVPFIPDTEQEK